MKKKTTHQNSDNSAILKYRGNVSHHSQVFQNPVSFNLVKTFNDIKMQKNKWYKNENYWRIIY